MSRDEIGSSVVVETSSSEDTEVARVLDLYLIELEAGRGADVESVLARHPAIAQSLRHCLEVMKLADHVANDSSARTLAGVSPPIDLEPQRHPANARPPA